MSFASLGLSEQLLQAISEKGYTEPSPIQAQAIPVILEGRDVMAAAQTGTGKTAGFVLPLLQRLASGKPASSNSVRSLILVPTRELAVQVGESVAQYGSQLTLRSCVVYGGVAINPQMMSLRKGADVLVATPGRLMDLYQKNAVKFHALEALILDEADRMLDLGFIADIQAILDLLPRQRQNLLFSATFSDGIRELAKHFLSNPVQIDISPRTMTAATVQQWIHPVDKRRKSELLSHLIRTRDWRQVLVFVRTRIGADKLVAELGRDGIRAVSIHSDKSQSWRARALADFKKGKASVLVATDVAARGIDIEQLPRVVNFDLPRVPEDYVHRIGRTGRAGSKGKAISLVCADEVGELRAIERLIRKRLTRDEISGFEPEHAVPASPSPDAPVKKKPKKPKKPKRKQLKAAKAGKPKKPKSPGRTPKGPEGKEGAQKEAGRSEGKPKAPAKDGAHKPKPKPKPRDGERPGTPAKRSGQARPGQAGPGQVRPGNARRAQS